MLIETFSQYCFVNISKTTIKKKYSREVRAMTNMIDSIFTQSWKKVQTFFEKFPLELNLILNVMEEKLF